MKLSLKNFRCYDNKTFEFNDDTITLINGPSGHGKSTILLAIQFAIYGLSGHKFLTSHGKVSCEVVLEYKNFRIKRTKRPNILNVKVDGKIYEDKEAQIILNKYFGATNSSVFFMDLSHSEKTEFLEKIVNVDCDVKDLKNQINTEISSLNKNMAVLDGQITNTESMIEIVQKPEKVEKPTIEDFFDSDDLKNLTKENLILKREESQKRLKDATEKKITFDKMLVEYNLIQTETEINPYKVGDFYLKSNQEIKELQKNLDVLKEKNNHLNKIRDKMFVVEENLKQLDEYKNINDDLLLEITEKINILEEKIQIFLRYKESQEFVKKKAEYNEALNLENKEWLSKVEYIKAELSKLNVDKTTLKNLSEKEKLYEKFKEAKTFNLKNNLNKINGSIEALKLKFFKSYNCSKCNHILTINMDTFEIVQDSIHNFDSLSLNPKRIKTDSEDIDTIKKELNKLENLKVKIEANNNFIQNTDEHFLMEEITTCKKFNELTKNLNQIGSFKPSISLIKMGKNLEKMDKNLKDVESHEIPILEDIDELKDIKRDLTIKQNNVLEKLKIKNDLLKKTTIDETYDSDHHEKIKKSIESTNEALNLKKIELEKIKNIMKLSDRLEALNVKIKNLNYNESEQAQIEQFLEKLNLALKYHEKFDKYKNFQIELKKYKRVKDTLKNFVQMKCDMEQTYHKTLLFKQKVIEAEHESLQFMVDIINTHLSILLQDFFSESFGDPIQIYLELLNDKRPQVNTVINYKGNKVDYKSLSTGEYARVKLAFDLTFKEILGENIIMLDECTANLDQDLSTKIFNKIKGSFPSKTILVVAHQVVTGTFDHVLHL